MNVFYIVGKLKDKTKLNEALTELQEFINKIFVPGTISKADYIANTFELVIDNFDKSQCNINIDNLLVDFRDKYCKPININSRTVVNDVITNTYIVTTDEKGVGGAYSNYEVYDKRTEDLLANINFQKGFKNDKDSIAGVYIEDLLHICIDRLECFQSGNYACIENEIALTHCKDALAILHYRIKSRIDRHVNDTPQK